jgi:hypothetical protein
MKAKFLMFSSPLLFKGKGCLFPYTGEKIVELLGKLPVFEGIGVQMPISLEGQVLSDFKDVVYEYLLDRLPTLPTKCGTEYEEMKFERDILGKKVFLSIKGGIGHEHYIIDKLHSFYKDLQILVEKNSTLTLKFER